MTFRTSLCIGATAAAVAISTLTAGQASATPPAPSKSRLINEFGIVLNRGADRNARINELSDPSAITGADNLAALEDTYGWEFNWDISDPVVSGDTMTTQLSMTLKTIQPPITKSWPLNFVDVDNHWKISKQSICMMDHQFQTTC